MTFGQFWRDNRWARDAVAPTIIIALVLMIEGAAARWMYTGVGLTLLMSLLVVVPTYWRREHPEVVFAITAPLALAQVIALPSPAIGDLAVPLVVHALAAYSSEHRWGWAGLAAGLLGAVLGPLRWYGGYGWYRDLPSLMAIVALAAMVVVIAFLIGRRDAAHRDEARAAGAERDRLLATDREQRAEMAAAAERTRIARELHDIVAHSLSVVVVQADGGLAAAKNKPEVAQQVLGTIAETARVALDDMRRLVGVLRAGVGAEEDHPDFAPAPTAADVPELVEQVRRAGQPVQLVIAGTARELPAGVGLAVYRVVQESLTNVIKHAGPSASAEVALHYGDDQVHVTVLDDGRGAAAFHDGMGNGLAGMRERVELQGGTVAAQPRAGGGFLVTASLPAPSSETDGAQDGGRPAGSATGAT